MVWLFIYLFLLFLHEHSGVRDLSLFAYTYKHTYNGMQTLDSSQLHTHNLEIHIKLNVIGETFASIDGLLQKQCADDQMVI